MSIHRALLSFLGVILFVGTLSATAVRANAQSVNFFFKASGSVLFLDNIQPTSPTAQIKDSTAVNFANGNPWKEVGTWSAAPSLTSGTLPSLMNLRLFVGLKNSDDTGTRFDIRAEVYRNDVLFALSHVFCQQAFRPITQVQATLSQFNMLSSPVFNGTTDVLRVRVLTRIGTNAQGGLCAGHQNAVGLRTYFNSTAFPARFTAGFESTDPDGPQFPVPAGITERGLDTAAHLAQYPACGGPLDAAPGNGALCAQVTLPSYRSLSAEQRMRFVYNSERASPRPVIPFNVAIPATAPVPPQLSYALAVGSGAFGSETFVDSSGLAGGTDNTIRSAVTFDGTGLATGLYSYTIRATSHYASGDRSNSVTRQVLIVNDQGSSIGAGWGVGGVWRLQASDGAVILTSGDGIALVFKPDGAGGFTSPPGDFSILRPVAGGAFFRELKDRTLIAFNPQGRQTSIQDRNGNVTSFVYDTAGRLVSITDPVGLVTTLTYTNGLLTAVTDPAMSVSHPAGRISTFQHDAAGNLTAVIFPDGSRRTFSYDARHLIVAETDERGFAWLRTYNHVGRLISAALPDDSTRHMRNAHGVGLVDPATGFGTASNPAPLERPEQALAVLTDGNGHQTILDVRRLEAVASVTDGLGRTTFIDRDANANPTHITRADGSLVTMTYDTKGNRLTRTEASIGATTQFSYHPTFNTVTSIIEPEGNQTTIQYDTRGNPIRVTDPAGVATVRTFDARGMVASIQTASGLAEQATTALNYNTRANLIQVHDPLNRTVVFGFDEAGNATSMRFGSEIGGRTYTRTYDAMNRMVAMMNPKGHITSYSYDLARNLITLTDPKERPTTFVFDALGRLSTRVNALDQTQTFHYDANGNLTSTTRRDGQVVAFEYDAANQRVAKTLPPISTETGPQVTTYSYDLVGRLIEAVTPETSTAFSYDGAGRMVAMDAMLPSVPQSVSLTYEYDLNGNRTRMTSPTGVTTYEYDNRNQATSITTAFGQTVTFDYDALRRRRRDVRPGGLVTEYTYDAASQLLTIAHRLGTQSINTITYAYDQFGDRIGKTDRHGVSTYLHDPLSQLVLANTPHPTVPLEMYVYDEVGNRIDSNQNGPSVFDAINRLLEDARFVYGYDANGNRTQQMEKATGAITTYEYNAENRLVRVALPDTRVVEFAYDGLGRRVREGVAYSTSEHYTAFLYDHDSIALEISGVGGGGVEIASAIDCAGGPVVAQSDSNGDGIADFALFYLSDGVGSVIDVIDATGGVVRSSSYVSFGEFTESASPASLPGLRWSFNGRSFEPTTQLYDYGKRVLRASTGSFLQEDPRQQSSGMTAYAYAANSPVGFGDVGGLRGVPMRAGAANAPASAGCGAAVMASATTAEPTISEQLHPNPLDVTGNELIQRLVFEFNRWAQTNLYEKPGYTISPTFYLSANFPRGNFGEADVKNYSIYFRDNLLDPSFPARERNVTFGHEMAHLYMGARLTNFHDVYSAIDREVGRDNNPFETWAEAIGQAFNKHLENRPPILP